MGIFTNLLKELNLLLDTAEVSEGCMIRKIPNKRKWKLISKKTGRNFGTFPSKKAALKREREIQAFKHMK